jgi:hypothetical protein
MPAGTWVDQQLICAQHVGVVEYRAAAAGGRRLAA